MGQFLPLFLQLTFSAAKEVVQIMAARIDIRILREVFMCCTLLADASFNTSEKGLLRQARRTAH